MELEVKDKFKKRKKLHKEKRLQVRYLLVPKSQADFCREGQVSLCTLFLFLLMWIRKFGDDTIILKCSILTDETSS